MREKTLLNYISQFLLAFVMLIPGHAVSQEESPCPVELSKKTQKIFKNAKQAYAYREYSDATQLLKEVLDEEPDCADAYFMLGRMNMKRRKNNLKAAETYFTKLIEICPEYDIYPYYYIGDILYGREDYAECIPYLEKFLEDVDKIKSDKDYNRAYSLLEYAGFTSRIIDNPVPFDPRPVEGISTKMDEYLPSITHDDEMALFTRRAEIRPDINDLVRSTKYREKFIYSIRENGSFDQGSYMPYPFNQHTNEGGATLTADNKQLFYTLCKMNSQNYFNCDICYSEFSDGKWGPIKNVSKLVNNASTWESQPSVTADGKILYFVSDRQGGYGGYDLYVTRRDDKGVWQKAENLGKVINSPGNEKSPFIHTDSRTLYFASEGHFGLGGYDIFYSRQDDDLNWKEPMNIGYPINSEEDDLGLFVSTSGKHAYFASDKLEGKGGWDIYSFDLYEEARPEKVLLVRGILDKEILEDTIPPRIELRNVNTRQIKEIPVDMKTGEYTGVVLFRDDYIMTVKKRGYAYESRYFAMEDKKNATPIKVNFEMKPVLLGETYRLNDIYFATDSFNLTSSSRTIIDGFIEFLDDNNSIKVAIEGHTDNVGDGEYNRSLSGKRAASVYNYLLARGINTSRLSYKGFGEAKPVASNDTEDGRSLNRRTIFRIIEK